MRLLVLISAVVALTVVLVTWTVSTSARRAFASLDRQRTAALVEQFRREFAAEGERVAARIERIAASDAVIRMAGDILRSRGDYTAHVNEASAVAGSYGVEFLDLVAPNGTIVSSAHWPARFGYRHPWLSQAPMAGRERGAFLHAVERPRGFELGLFAVRAVGGGKESLMVVGGRGLDQELLENARPSAWHTGVAVPQRGAGAVATSADRRVGRCVERRAARAADRTRAPERPRSDRKRGMGRRRRDGRRHSTDWAGRRAARRSARGAFRAGTGVPGVAHPMERFRFRRARNSLRSRCELCGRVSRDPPRGAARGRGTIGCERRLERPPGRSEGHRRNRGADARLPVDDRPARRSARAVASGGAGGRLARACPPAGSRAEEPAVSSAPHHRQPPPREVAAAAGVRGSAGGEPDDARDGTRKPQHGYRTIQRLLEDATAAVRAGVPQRHRSTEPPTVPCTAGGAGPARGDRGHRSRRIARRRSGRCGAAWSRAAEPAAQCDRCHACRRSRQRSSRAARRERSESMYPTAAPG